MELEHSFTVPVPRSRAWDVLLDVEKVAPCMPGATLDSVDGDEIRGRIKVKVGPINMVYAGTARFIERDADAGVVTLEASGKETRGSGTASASVHSVLEDRGEETHVKVRTTLNVTGKPAQFGRGVMNEVSGKLLNIFAANLAATIARDDEAADGGGSDGSADGAAASAGSSGPDGGSAAASGTTGPAAAGPGTGNGASADTSAAPGSTANANGAASHSTAADLGTSGGGTFSSSTSKASGTATPVEELSLPVRATASLHREGLHTAGEVAAKTEQELLAIEGIGPASLVDIKAKLSELGLSLAGLPEAAAGIEEASSATPPTGTPTASTPAAATPAPAQAAATPAASAGVARRPAPVQPAQAPEDDSLNLLKVAGLPVLKRAAPVLAAVGAALIIGLTRKLRHRKR